MDDKDLESRHRKASSNTNLRMSQLDLVTEKGPWKIFTEKKEADTFPELNPLANKVSLLNQMKKHKTISESRLRFLPSALLRKLP